MISIRGDSRGGPGGGGDERPNLLPIIRLVLAPKLSCLGGLPSPSVDCPHRATSPRKPSPVDEVAEIGETDVEADETRGTFSEPITSAWWMQYTHSTSRHLDLGNDLGT